MCLGAAVARQHLQLPLRAEILQVGHQLFLTVLPALVEANANDVREVQILAVQFDPHDGTSSVSGDGCRPPLVGRVPGIVSCKSSTERGGDSARAQNPDAAGTAGAKNFMW